MRNIYLAFLIGIGVFVGLFAGAGTIIDTDGDRVPDVFDNCRNIPNGPIDTCDQLDSDDDGFGNVCDCDLDGDGVTGGGDFGGFVGAFGGTGPFSNSAADFDCDGVVAGSDFAVLITCFGSAPGPGASAL